MENDLKSVSIIKADICELELDAIVNAANNTLLGGGGVDGAIHRKGGSRILEQCKLIGGCPTGEAVITNAGDLKAKYVIHTVGPVYSKENPLAEKLLYRAYYNSLLLAKDYKLKSIAFPSISTGAYGYPIDQAMVIASKAIKDFLAKEEYEIDITLVLFSDEDYNLYAKYYNIAI